jgi:hypothetical protein
MTDEQRAKLPANRILDLGGDVKIEARPEVKVYDAIVEYLKSEKRVSEEGIAQVSDMMPAFRKPMTMTVVAPELWMAAAVRVPMPTPSSLLLDAPANSWRSLLEPAVSRLRLSMEHATRKIPMPARRPRIAVRIWTCVMADLSFGRKNGNVIVRENDAAWPTAATTGR